MSVAMPSQYVPFSQSPTSEPICSWATHNNSVGALPTPSALSCPPKTGSIKPRYQQKQGLLDHLIFAVWDFAWRQWYNVISTWGISVMEPWEAVFTLLLFAALITIFGVAVWNSPTYARYATTRLGYYLFGSATSVPTIKKTHVDPTLALQTMLRTTLEQTKSLTLESQIQDNLSQCGFHKELLESLLANFSNKTPINIPSRHAGIDMQEAKPTFDSARNLIGAWKHL